MVGVASQVEAMNLVYALWTAGFTSIEMSQCVDPCDFELHPNFRDMVIAMDKQRADNAKTSLPIGQ